MDIPEKLAKQGTQEEETQSKNTTQYVLDTTTGKQTQITNMRHETWSPLQTSRVKDEPNIVVMRKS